MIFYILPYISLVKKGGKRISLYQLVMNKYTAIYMRHVLSARLRCEIDGRSNRSSGNRILWDSTERVKSQVTVGSSAQKHVWYLYTWFQIF
jgi:hypothetical protein